MLRRAQGELVVFLQDFISIPTTGLERFWEAYQREPAVFFTAPVGKTVDNIAVSWDWRRHHEGVDNLNFMEWEIDWASAPLSALKDIGGFDEELDKFWGFDNVNIGLRAAEKGYIIKNIPGNPAVAWDHNAYTKHPYQPLRNPEFHNQRLQDIQRGEVVVKYL